MALKHILDTLDGVHESIKPHYVFDDKENKYFLQAEGMVAKARLDEFRTNNIELTNKLKTFEGIDPVEYATLKESAAKGKKPDEAAIEREVANRVATMKSELEGKVNTLTKSNETMSTQLRTLVIDNAVRAAATKAGALPHAVDDILLRAQGTFKFENGTAVPYDQKGNPIYGPDGSTHMSPEQWATGLKKTAPHLFPNSTGGGGPGGGPGGSLDTSKMSANDKIKAGLEARS